ncbi:MAG: electron transport complex subunit RsxC [Chromatocurvus sp.]
MRRVHDFHGGIHPAEHKSESMTRCIESAGIPDTLVVPVGQHIGSSAVPVVAPGQRVLGGEEIAEADGAFSVPCHAPTSGMVLAIEDRPVPHPSGLSALCIILQPDGRDERAEPRPFANPLNADPLLLTQHIQQAGIAGMGGAGFPTAVKLSPRPGKPIQTLVINGTECEPYITADDSLMRERADAVISGSLILAHILGKPDILLGIEDNKPEAITALKKAAAGTDVEIVVFPTKYPSGGEKQLIEILLGAQVPSGSLPADIGVVCQNVGTAAAVHNAVVDGRPLVSRITTVTGEAVSRPGNYEVLLGTPISHLLTLAGHDAAANQRLVMGGPMMGFTVNDLDCPVIKTSNCLLLPTEAELPTPPPPQACIRCGLCAEACPASLLPQQLFWYSRGRDHDRLEAHNLFDCIECGACAYVCPSHIPLVQYYRASKAEIIAHRQDAERAEHARQRFEARQQRIEKQAREKAERREARKRAAEAKAAAAATDGNAGSDPIQAAIERAQARKAALADAGNKD